MIRLEVGDVENLFDTCEPLGVVHEQTALRNTPWGTREFAFDDPDRHGLTFYHDL